MDPMETTPPPATTAPSPASTDTPPPPSAVQAAPPPSPSPPQQPPAPPPAQQQQQPPAQQHISSSSSSASEPTVSAPSPSPQNPPPQPQPQPRPQFLPQQRPMPSALLTRARAPLPSPSYPSFSTSSSSSPSLMSSHSLPPSSGPIQRGGMAVGVPAHHHQPRAQQQGGPVPFSSYGPNPSFGQPFVGMPPRSSIAAQDQPLNSSAQTRTIGAVGSLTTASQMRPSGLPAHHQQRPGPSTLRPPSQATNQPGATQKLANQNLMRASSMVSLSSPSLGQSQSSQQAWTSAQGKAVHASSPSSTQYRPQVRPQQQQQQQRPHLSQQASTSQQQQLQLQQKQVHQQQQQLQQQQQQQQLPPKSHPNNLQQQQLASRVQGIAGQKTVPLSSAQASTVQSGIVSPSDAAEPETRILSKRTIHELVSQVDPSEKLDPEVEDILVEIADDFIESVTATACSFAKHRKSTMLEAKDILLHLERNWNMTLPGFSGDEIKLYKKPFANEIHKDRLAVIKKSMVGTLEGGGMKNSTPGQAAGNAKSNPARTVTASKLA